MNIEEMRDIVRDCHFPGWRIRVKGDTTDGAYLQVSAIDACAATGNPIEWSGRKWILSSHMVKSEIVQTAMRAVLTSVEHEARESFQYRGQSIFGPHFDVDRLFEMCKSGNATEVRK